MEDKNKIEIVSDGTRLMSYAEHERIRKNQKIGIGLAVILVAFSLFLAFWNRNFNAYEELRYTQNTEGNGTRYEAYMEGFLKYSKDGISYLNQKDAVQWTAAYTMSKPEAVVQGEYAAVADMEGNAVQLYDRTGKIGEYSMSYPIKKIMVAKQGVFGVVLDAQKNIISDYIIQTENFWLKSEPKLKTMVIRWRLHYRKTGCVWLRATTV